MSELCLLYKTPRFDPEQRNELSDGKNDWQHDNGTVEMEFGLGLLLWKMEDDAFVKTVIWVADPGTNRIHPSGNGIIQIAIFQDTNDWRTWMWGNTVEQMSRESSTTGDYCGTRCPRDLFDRLFASTENPFDFIRWRKLNTVAID